MLLLTDQLKMDVKNYLINFDVNNSFGVTLTLQQGIKNQKLDKISSSQNLRHFLNVLNQKCFGNQSKRFNKRLKVLSVIEISKWKRLHFHLTLENPFPNDPNRFSYLINSVWKKTKFGHKHIHINSNIDEGWNDYITKFDHKDDEVDWMNFHS